MNAFNVIPVKSTPFVDVDALNPRDTYVSPLLLPPSRLYYQRHSWKLCTWRGSQM